MLSFRYAPAAGLNAEALDHDGEQFRQLLSDMLWSANNRDSAMAVLVEAASQPHSADHSTLRQNNDAFARDRQWWVGLKRKLNGSDQRWTTSFVCPRPIEGPAARALREGAAQEAGMNPQGIAMIDAICTEWGANSDEGFTVCIARHGVIALHKAYGQRNARPTQLSDTGSLASITKVLSGTAIMLLVDQGLVRLDDPVEKFLPAFGHAKPKTSATIHHLYTHTAGMWDHWGDDLHDFDEAIGEYHPHMQVGRQFEYNGASQALGGKIIETITGEAMPTYCLNHLLAPLKMDHTDCVYSGTRATSTALDLAKLGQMLVNGGAYGNMRFMEPQTLEQMLPRRLTTLLGEGTGVERGIGLTWDTENPLGPKTFGHGAASQSIFAVNIEKDIVVVMLRNNPGTNFGKYDPMFRKAVAEAVVGK
jgi:CubicO group peptidase (beta-lactamase class C family)